MRLTHVFVDSFPEPLEEGKLYVSMRYATVAHLCACGCGNEVVTPLRKHGWKLTFDGENITLSPSVGNHNLACQSHYFIRENEIRWAGRLSPEEIRAGRMANQQGGIDYGYTETNNNISSSDTSKPISDEKMNQCPEPRLWWEYFLLWKWIPRHWWR